MGTQVLNAWTVTKICALWIHDDNKSNTTTTNNNNILLVNKKLKKEANLVVSKISEKHSQLSINCLATNRIINEVWLFTGFGKERYHFEMNNRKMPIFMFWWMYYFLNQFILWKYWHCWPCEMFSKNCTGTWMLWKYHIFIYFNESWSNYVVIYFVAISIKEFCPKLSNSFK